MKNLKKLSCSVVLAAMMLPSATTAVAQRTDADPVWLESDSAAAIKSRLRQDFSLTFEEGRKAINARYKTNYDSAQIREFANKKYVETRVIDGVERMHRKSPSNLALLNPEMNGHWQHRGATASDKRISYVDSVLAYYDGNNALGAAHSVTYRFVIDVPYNPALKGDTLRVWMPLPLKSDRQSQIKILNTFPAKYVVSDPAKSFHNTIYFTQPVTEGKTTHFEATVSFVTKGQYFSPEYIRRNIRPYDKQSELYKRYTAIEAPHVIKTDLARQIVGNENDPYRQSELVYDYIINNYPWAGAREYSTIECIPQYVLDEKHGDCGQVSLLYISLMRSLGVPARWESGWMLHPGEKNWHDWAEVYFEGVGWVPVDCSFGRYTPGSDPRVVKFYSTGMDAHRFASNHGVSGKFDPEKKWVRSETVDLQPGEVECTRGNIFYPGWSQKLELLDVHPVERDNAGTVQQRAADAIDFVKKQYAPDKRQVIYNVTPVYGPDGKVAVSGTISDRNVHDQLFRALRARGIDAADYVTVTPDTVWAMSRLSVAHVRQNPSHAAEMGSQCLMGMPMRVVGRDDDWLHVQTPDGYLGWVTSSSVVQPTDAEMKAWRGAKRLIVVNPYQTRAYSTAKANGLRHVVTDLVTGDIVEGSLRNVRNGRVEITLPDKRKAWVNAADVEDLDKWAAQKFDAQKILDQAYSMEGSPYFWGGTSIKNLDCSGLAKVSYLANGIILRRDASQQALTGTRIDPADWKTLQPGDLLFFGNGRTGKVTHVAIYDHDGMYIHSSGRVKRNSVDPESPYYLTTPFLHAVRIAGNEGTDGIIRLQDHPWYYSR